MLNEESLSRQVFLKRLGALLTAEALRMNGGYLFKAGFMDTCFQLGIIPGYRCGERGYHYNIRLAVEDAFTFIGGIKADYEINCIFASREILQEHLDIYRRNYRRLAEVFTECTGESLPLDWVTRRLMRDYNIFPEDPSSLIEIVY